MKTLFRKHLFGIAVVLMVTGVITTTALAETYTATAMRLLRYEGTVEIEDTSGQPRAAVENARFSTGESLHTGSASSASVGLDTNKIVTLDENTRVQFTKQAGAMQVSVSDGTVFMDVKEKLQENEKLDIQTSTMSVGIRGTVVSVSNLPLEVFRQKMTEMKATNSASDQNQYFTDLEEALQNIPSDGSAGRVSTIGLFEGSVEIQFVNSTGTRQTLVIEEGQKATLIDLNEDGEIDRVPVQGKVTEEDIFPAAKEEIKNDSVLNNRVQNGGFTVTNGNDQNSQNNQNKQNENWTDNSRITVIAQSASKMFDGKALTHESDVLIQGLPTGYTAFAAAKGSQTDVGTGVNRVETFIIYDADGKNVTSHFTNISKVTGKLKVDPAPLTVSSGSAQKIYDGTPLTSTESQIIFSPGYEKKTVTQRNLSYVVTKKTSVSTSVSAASASSAASGQNGQNGRSGQNVMNPGAQTLYGICGTVLVHGSNPLTGEIKEFSLHAGERLTVYLSDKDSQNSIEYVIEKVTVQDLPEDILRLYKDNPDLMAQACLEAGWLPEDLQKRIDDLKIQESEKKTKDDNGLYVDSIDPENLMKDFTNVRITVDTAGTDYNNRALTREEAHFTPVNVDTSIKIINTGTITDVGTINNTFTIDWGNAKKENYILSETTGTLTVLPAAATVTTGSAEKEYDGTPLTSSEATITGLVNNETATVIPTGFITEVGTSDNTYDIDWGTAKKENYTVSSNTGTLKVIGNTTPINIRITFTGKTYDGTPLNIDHIEVEGQSSGAVSKQDRSTGKVTTQSVTAQGRSSGSVTAQRSSTGKVSAQSGSAGIVTVEGLPVGYRFKAKVSGTYTDAGTCKLTLDSYHIYDPDGKEVTDGFVAVEITECTVTIDPAPVTVTTGSATKAYDGTPLTSDEASITGLIEADAASVTVTPTGSITDVGTSENTYDINWGKVKSGNYSLTENLGTLEITVNDTPITLTAASDSKTYDGSPLTAGDVTAEGLPEGFTFTAETEGGQTDAGTGNNTVSSYKILNTDGEDVTASFSNISTVDGTLTVNPAEATVITGSATKAYDGTPLTKDEASITGLTEKDAASVTVSANGSITDVGTNANTYDIDWGTAKSENYTITEEIGTLEVTANDTPIIFTAASDSKIYDGSPLTAGDVTAGGLPEGFTYTAKTKGSLTDAGSSKNAVSSYKILNADGEDVTASFSNISTVDGTLTVSPAEATVTTASSTKAYDGTALSKKEASITGLVEKDAASVTVTANGSITDVGTTANTYDISWGTVNSGNYILTKNLGTLEVTANDTPITFTAASDSKIYDGSPLTADDVTAVGLLEGFTFTAETQGSQTNAGSSKNTVSAYKILNADGKDVTSSFANISTAEGTLAVEKLKVNVDFGDITEPYNGTTHAGAFALTFLNGEEEGVYPVSDGSDWTWTTGTRYFTFYTGDKFTIVWNRVGPDAREEPYTITLNDYTAVNEKSEDTSGNYDIELTRTSLTITPAEITVVTGSAEKVYDGKPLTKEEASITGLADEDKDFVTVTATGTITNAGSTTNTYTIAWDDESLKNNYDLKEELGTLTVEKLKINIDYGDLVEPYNQTTHAGGFALTFLNGQEEGVNQISYSDSWTWYTGTRNFKFFTGDKFTVVWNRVGPDAREEPYTITLNKYSAVNESSEDTSGNYEIELTRTSLTITPVELTVTTGSAEKVYDGTELTNSEASITGFLSGESADVTATGSLKNAGTAKNTYSVNWGTAKECNYTLKEDLGTLTVEKLKINIDYGDLVEPYNNTTHAGGFALTFLNGQEEGVNQISYSDSWTWYTGTRNFKFFTGDKFTVVWNRVGPDAREEPYTITLNKYSAVNESSEDTSGNYEIELTGTSLTITPVEAKVTTSPAIKEYDGKPLTNAEASISGLIGDDNWAVKVTATGTITDVGTTENTYTIDWGTAKAGNYILSEDKGTLEVTKNNTAIKITAASGSKPYDGKPLTAEDFEVPYTVEGEFPADHLISCQFKGSQTNVGKSTNKISSFRILNAEEKDVTEYFTGINTANGTLEVIKNDTQITFTSASAEKAYDGKPLTATHVTVDGLPEGLLYRSYGDDSIAFSDVGTYKNRFARMDYTLEDEHGNIQSGWRYAAIYDRNKNDVTDYFTNIRFVQGTLNITKNDTRITFTSASDEKVYDGTPLTATSVTVDGLPEGLTYESSAGAFIPSVNAGTYENYFNDMEYSYGDEDGNIWSEWRYAVIYDSGGNDVTDNFTNINFVRGTLTIHKLKIRLDFGDLVEAYNKTTHAGKFSFIYLNGEKQGQSPVADEYFWTVSRGKCNLTLFTGDKSSVEWSRVGPDARNEPYTIEVLKTTFTNSESVNTADNFEIVTTGTSLTITPAELTVTTGSAEKVYDGTPLTNPEASITGFMSAELADVTATGTLINAGTAKNTYSISWGTAKESNYTLKENLGTLTVNKATATVKTGSIEDYLTIPENEYGEAALTCDEASITGIADSDKDQVTVRATGRNYDPGTTVPNTYEIDWGTADSNNYNIAEELGTIKLIDIVLYDPHYFDGDESGGGMISEPGLGSAVPADDEDKQTSDTDNSADSGKADSNNGKTDKDTGKADKDSGKTDQDTGKTNQDTGKADKDTGEADRGSGKTDKDTGKTDDTKKSEKTVNNSEGSSDKQKDTDKNDPASKEKTADKESNTGSAPEKEDSKKDTSEKESDRKETDAEAPRKAEKSEESEKSEKSEEAGEPEKAEDSEKPGKDDGSGKSESKETVEPEKKEPGDSDKKETGTPESKETDKEEKKDAAVPETRENDSSEKKEDDGSGSEPAEKED